ncbi:MAG: acyl-CoA/acyl-ACP dehydrogenase [Myxococcales bacterium]|nr:acyl-CoA/acyl-ACP dehydrogenase [Myxococcales bacterium]
MAFDFERSEELSLLVRTARELAEQQLAPAQRDSERARGVADDLRRGFDSVGLSRLELPESLGGAGLGALARVLVNEELGAGDPGAALALDPAGVALYAVEELAGEGALGELIAPLLDEPGARALLALAPDGLDLGTERIEARLPWVAAARCDLLVLLDRRRAVVVREGLELEPVPGSGLRAAGASSLSVADAPVLARYEDEAGASRALARARLHTASLLLGVLRKASEYARAYAQERVAFGKPIAHHQALAFMLTDMHAAVELARLLVHEAAWWIDQRRDDAAACAACASAFVEVVEASRFIGPAGVQVLGGHGFMQDHPVEKHNREARALSLLLGGVDAAREDAGRVLAEEAAPVALSTAQGEGEWTS